MESQGRRCCALLTLTDLCQRLWDLVRFGPRGTKNSAETTCLGHALGVVLLVTSVVCVGSWKHDQVQPAVAPHQNVFSAQQPSRDFPRQPHKAAHCYCPICSYSFRQQLVHFLGLKIECGLDELLGLFQPAVKTTEEPSCLRTWVAVLLLVDKPPLCLRVPGGLPVSSSSELW